MATNATNVTNEDNTLTIEPYRLSEIFSIVPEFDGNPVFLQTFITACVHAQGMAVEDQRILLTLHIKNRLRGKAAELVNSRNPATWPEIKNLLEAHFGDSRDLTALIQDLQRIYQLQNENALTFVSRLQTHNAKMHSAVQKQSLTLEEKSAQSNLIETMTLNTLLTGLEPKIGHIIRAGNPSNMLDAINRIKRELQLSYFEQQKFQNRMVNKNPILNQQRRPLPPQKTCSFCKRNGHTFNECRTRQNQQYASPNFSPNNYSSQTHFSQQNSNFRPNNFGSPPQFSRPNYQNFSQQNNQPSHSQQNRQSAVRTNPNFNQQRPPAIQPNPNFHRFNQQKAHHLNYEPYVNQYQFNQYENHSPDYQVQNDTYENNNFEISQNYNGNYTANSQIEQYEDYTANPQDFYENPEYSMNTPTQESDQIDRVSTQIQALNLNNPKPSPNHTDQNFI